MVSAPTSSGKTFIGELAAFHEAYKGGRVVYLVPLRAVAEEKFDEFRERYKDYGVTVVISTGEHREYDEDLLTGNFHIAVVVFEKLLNLSVVNPAILDSFTLTVVDECQMISDESRGARLKILLTKIRKLATRPRIIGLSAVAENTGDFDSWLHCKLLSHKERPVELREGIVTNDFVFAYQEWNTGAKGTENLADGPSNEALALPALCAHLLQRGDQILVFTDTPDATTTHLEDIINSGVTAPAATEALANLASLEATDIRERLSESLVHGMAMHNGDMLLQERLLVERYFRDGHIRLVCATSTLAMGAKPREILGASANYSPLFGCLVIGRPDFVQDAINEAPAISRELKPYALMTVSGLAELYVLWREGRVTQEQAEGLLVGGDTYLDMERVGRLGGASHQS